MRTQTIAYVEGFVEAGIEIAAIGAATSGSLDTVQYYKGRLDAMMELAKAAGLDIQIGPHLSNEDVIARGILCEALTQAMKYTGTR